MISNIDLTTINADVMSMELDKIKFSQLEVGETLNVEITVYDVDTNIVLDSWYNTYYADSRGEVLLADLARVWNNYILYRRRVTGEDAVEPSEYVGGIKVKFELWQSSMELPAAITGSSINSQGAAETSGYTRDYGITDFIPLEQGQNKVHVVSGAWQRASMSHVIYFYSSDSESGKISGYRLQSGNTALTNTEAIDQEFAVPSGATHYRLTIKHDTPAIVRTGGVDTVINRNIWYSTRQDGKTVADLNAVLPFLSLDKRTFDGAAEMVQLIGIVQETLSITAYYERNGSVTATTYTPEAADSNAFGVCYWVSPLAVQSHIPLGAKLLRYEVHYVSSVCKYEMEYGNYAQKSQFIYLNRWGVYESLWCVGSQKWNIKRAAEIGLSGGELTPLDIDVDDTYEVSTGYVDTAVLEQLRDLSESPLVWLLDNATFKKVAIDDVKMERVLPSNEARTATITYRYANRNM